MSASASSGGLKCRQRGCKENAPRACVAGKCPKHCDAGPDHGKCEGHVKRIRSAGGGSDRGHAGKAGKQRAHIFFTLIVEAVRVALEDHDDHHKQTLKEFNMTQDQATGQVVGEVRRRIVFVIDKGFEAPFQIRIEDCRQDSPTPAANFGIIGLQSRQQFVARRNAQLRELGLGRLAFGV